MKKVIKLSLFLVSIFAVLAACKAPVVGTAVDERSFELNADDKGSGTEHFTVGAVTVTEYDAMYTTLKQHLVSIQFSQPIDADGVKNGVSFYKLTDASDYDKMPGKQPLLVVGEVKIVDRIAYFTVNTDTVKDLYMFIKADAVTSRTGQHLNEDKDDIDGEPGDDDYAIHLINSGSLVGNVDFDKETIYRNKSLSGRFNPVFVPGDPVKEDAHITKKVIINSMPFENLCLLAEQTDQCNALSKSLSGYLKVEQFDWANNEWGPEQALTFTWDASTHQWEAPVSVAENRAIRFKWVNTDAFKVKTQKYGYELRWSLKNNDSTIETQGPMNSGYLSLSASTDADTTNLAVSPMSGEVEIQFTPGSYDLWADSGWRTVTSANATPTKPSLFAGFDVATVTKDNFICLDGAGEPIAIKEVHVIQSDVGTYPYAQDVIKIYFENRDLTATEVYMSPAVKTASYQGSYLNASSVLVVYSVPAMSFANVLPAGNYQQKGWVKIF